MSWLDVVADNRAVLAVYGGQTPPPLDPVVVQGITVHRDGPNIVVAVELPAYPANPPKKWAAQGFDTAQMSLQLVGVEDVTLTGWDVDVVGAIVLEQFDDKVVVTLDSPACSLRCSAIAVYVQNISAYQSA